jgi:UDP-glucose 4-epimerase
VKVLVTGGAGFIGANLVRMLIERSYRVLVLDNLSAGNYRDHLAGLNVGFVEGNILDPQIVIESVKWSDSVIHLAGQTSIVNSVSYPKNDFVINVLGGFNVLEVCRELDIERFVFSSSNSVTQYWLSPYSTSKWTVEGYCLMYHNVYGMKTVALRLPNVYGPYSRHKNSVVAKWFKNKEIIVEGGQQTRDFIHVKDVCHAIIMALESDVSGEIFQVGTEIETALSDLAEIVAPIIGATIKYGPPRRNDKKRDRSYISKTRSILGWQSTINLNDGLKDTWEWFN